MILIDKEKFIEEVRKRKYSAASIKLIEEQPEVMAIPRAWIAQYSRKPITNADYWAIIRMVTEWEKENETNRCG